MNFKIFAEEELQAYFSHKAHGVISGIEQEKEDYLLNVNEDDYVQHKASEMLVDEVNIHADQVYASSREKIVPAAAIPNSFRGRAGQSCKRDVITFHIPVSGALHLLRTKPSRWIAWSMPVDFNQNEISFDIINFSDDAEAITREKDQNIKGIMEQLENVNVDVVHFNAKVESRVRDAVQARKERIQRKTGVLSALGVPIRKSDDAPTTFAIPAPEVRKQISVERPVVKDSQFNPEPTLDSSTYMQILKLVHEVGKQFERQPSVYKGKEEEHLRDHILMILEPNFIGSATGETFNKSGKTDILLRHEGNNVFIAECKFWKGEKGLIQTVSQLLGYLTWRDSKAAVIVFVQNKDFTKVLEAASAIMRTHPNYLKQISAVDDTWSIHHIHLNGDRNRIVHIALMLFHLPT